MYVCICRFFFVTRNVSRSISFARCLFYFFFFFTKNERLIGGVLIRDRVILIKKKKKRKCIIEIKGRRMYNVYNILLNRITRKLIINN